MAQVQLQMAETTKFIAHHAMCLFLWLRSDLDGGPERDVVRQKVG